MFHIRYGLLCWCIANKTKLNEINILLNKGLRCIHYKKCDKSVKKHKNN